MKALFIGSFNPPTLAHLDISLKLFSDYSNIIFVPVSSQDKNLIDINDRINMLLIYQKKYPFIEIDDIMKNYAYLNYRIIDLLKDKYGKFAIIIGSDLLDKLDNFDNYKYLLENYSFIVLNRASFNASKIIQRKYLNYQKKFKVINYHNNISSTLVREKLLKKENTENILDSDVLNYIKTHHLY